MKNAKQILESIYKVYNKQEEIEEYGEEKSEYRPDFSSDDLRKQFIGTIMTGSDDPNPWALLKAAIDKMPDEWVAEFLQVVNGDEVEKVSESVTESKDLIFKEENTDSWTKEKVIIIIGFLINVPEFEEKYGMEVNKIDTGYVLKTRSGKQFTITIENGERDI